MTVVTGPQGPPGPRDGQWAPSDYGLITWAFDPPQYVASVTLATNRIYAVRLRLQAGAPPITGIAFAINVVGVGLVAGQCCAALYQTDSSRALIAKTGDTSADWSALGLHKSPFVGGPVTLPAGQYYVAFWCMGTTGPNILRQNNGNLYGTVPMFVTRGGITDPGPGSVVPDPLPAFTNVNYLVLHCGLY